MPLNRYVVRVDPQGQTVVVDVLDTSGASVIAYESSQFGAATLTLPLTITAQTDFWLHDPGAYDISCKVGGAEVADAGAPKRVQLSDVPVLVVPDWERERTASPGGSSAVQMARYICDQVIPTGGSATTLAWITNGGSIGILDLTIPTAPVAVVAGNYWITASVKLDVAAAPQAGKTMDFELDADFSGLDPLAFVRGYPLDGTQQPAAASVALASYVPAGGTFYLGLNHDCVASTQFQAEIAVLFQPVTLAV